MPDVVKLKKEAHVSDMEQLKASVIAQTHEKGKALLAEAEKTIEADFELKEKQLLQEKAALREKELQTLKRRLQRDEQQIQNQERQSTLVTKNAVLQEMFKAAQDKMSLWSGDEQLAFLSAILKRYEGQSLTVQLGQLTRERFEQGHWDRLSQAFPQVTFDSQAIPNEAGMLISTGQVDDNFLYSSLVQSMWNEESYRLATAIFTEE